MEPYRSIQDIVRDLAEPVEERYIRHRKQGGSNLSYIEWHVAALLLDQMAPGWSWTIHEVRETTDGTLVVHGSLTIPTCTGPVTRHATGIEALDNKGYGDPVSNAAAMAFKRAGALFGLGRHLYSKEHLTPATARKAFVVAAPDNDWRPRLIEVIRDLRNFGMSDVELQDDMEKIAGVRTRDKLTDGKGIAVLRHFEQLVLEYEQFDEYEREKGHKP